MRAWARKNKSQPYFDNIPNGKGPSQANVVETFIFPDTLLTAQPGEENADAINHGTWESSRSKESAVKIYRPFREPRLLEVFLRALSSALVLAPKCKHRQLLGFRNRPGKIWRNRCISEGALKGSVAKAWLGKGKSMMEMDKMKVTPRDRQVLDLLVQGCSNKEIAGQLSISPRTVKQHLRTLFLRAGIRDGRKRVRLATAAFEDAEMRS
jgi:DNA-binding CsgD family transcriptional regulator